LPEDDADVPFPLGDAPGDVPFGDGALGYVPLGDGALVIVPLDDGALVIVPLGDGALVDAPLVAAPLVGVPLVGVPLVDVPLVDVPLVDVPLVDVPLVVDELVDVPLVDDPLVDVTVGVLPVKPKTEIWLFPLEIYTLPFTTVGQNHPGGAAPELYFHIGPAVIGFVASNAYRVPFFENAHKIPFTFPAEEIDISPPFVSAFHWSVGRFIKFVVELKLY